MPQEKVKKIHLIYGCIAAVIIVALGIALILSCLDIYNSGPRPYSPESIALRFQRIAILAYACIAIAVGGIIMGLAMPAEKKKPKAIRDERMTTEKLKAKVSVLSPEDTVAVKKEETHRLLLRIGTAVLFAVLMIYPAIYFMDGSHFTITALNEDIRKAVCIALIPALIGLVMCFICSELESKSISRETDIYKKAIAENQSIVSPAAPAEPHKKINAIMVARGALLAVAVCFIVLGIFNGGMKDVLDKAVAICTECIGLG